MIFDKYIVNIIYYASKCEREDEFGLCAEAKPGR